MTMQSFEADFGRGQAVFHRFYSSDASTENDASHSNKEKTPLHFFSANGLPAASYDFFLSQFSDQYDVCALEHRGVWPNRELPDKRLDWRQHVDDLIAFLDSDGRAPYIGMGHSLGAWCTAVAASKRPDLFSRVILIDPATLPLRILAFGMRNFSRLAYKVPLVKGTAARRQYWNSREEFAQSMATKAAYKRFSKTALQSYAEHGLVAFEGELEQLPLEQQGNPPKFTLRYRREWEAHNYSKTPYIWARLKKVKCSALMLCAEQSYLYSKRSFAKGMAKMPDNVEGAILGGLSHLAPQENPEQVAEQVKAWLLAAETSATS